MSYAATVDTAPAAIRPVINAERLRRMLMATATLALAGNVLFACVSSGGDSDSGWTISSSSDCSSSDSGGDSGGGGDGGGE